MSGAEQRLPVFPSRMVLASIKERLSAAKKGYDLLKRKGDAIKLSLNSKLKDVLVVKRRMGDAMRKAAFSHTEAVWAAGDFINHQVMDNTKQASYKVKAHVQNVAGVKLPVFERAKDDAAPKDFMVGLSRGGEQVQKCKTAFSSLLDDLIQLASLQTSVKTLDDALKVTNRRVNALEFVIMPRLSNTIKYINAELDELEREDNYRIKKVRDVMNASQVAYDSEGNQISGEEAAEIRRQEAEKVSQAPTALDSFESSGKEDLVADLF